MTTVTIHFDDDGTIRIDGIDSPDVTAWCARHDKTVTVGLTRGALLDPGTEFGDAPAVVESDGQRRTAEALGRGVA